jgi:hypothetical protein
MKKLITLVCFLFALTASAQQLNCTVTVNSEKISNANPNTFRTLETAINDFVNRTDWTGQAVKQNERINCSMFITLNSFESNNFSGTIQIQSSRPVLHSTYSTPIFNFNDNNLNFSYVEFESLNFDPNSFNSNLISVVSFYSYIILGLDADTFAPGGGDPFYSTAHQISTVAQPQGGKGWSQSDGNQTRYFLINDLLSSTYKPYRQAMFEYHFEGLDIMADDLQSAKEGIVQSLTTLSQLYNVRPNAFLTRVFFDAKSDEIVSIFSGGPKMPIAEIVDNLNRISPTNSSKWASIKF